MRLWSAAVPHPRVGAASKEHPMSYSGPIARVVPTSGLAVSGFVLALLGVGPAGLWLSLAAFKHTRTGERGGHGLAVAGAVIGGLVTAVWAFGMLAFAALMVAADLAVSTSP
jgi:hypothetical protein